MGVWPSPKAGSSERSCEKEENLPCCRDRNSSELSCLQHRDLVRQSARTLQQFMAFVEPPKGANEDEKERDIPIAQWTTLYASKGADASTDDGNETHSSVVVRAHPSSDRHLYAVESVMPGVTARQFWTLMADSRNRHLWDGTVEEVVLQSWLGSLDEQNADDIPAAADRDAEYCRIAASLSARVEILRFGSIMMVTGKRDMVLLCVDARLPSNDPKKLRLLSTSSSINDTAVPRRKGYNRFHLNIGGFLVEDVGDHTSVAEYAYGVRVTQLSDLGSMASWVPASVVRMVAGSLVPRSISVIAKAAAKVTAPRSLAKGNEDGEGYAGAEQGIENSSDDQSAAVWYASRQLPTIVREWELIEHLAGIRKESRPLEQAPSLLANSPQGDVRPPLSLQPLSTTLQTSSTELSLEHSPFLEPSIPSTSASIIPSSPISRMTASRDSGTVTNPRSPSISMANSQVLTGVTATQECDTFVRHRGSLADMSEDGIEESVEANPTLASFSTEDENEICALLSEALHDDDVFNNVSSAAPPSQDQIDRRTQAWVRMSRLQQRQRDAVQRRLSTLLLQGSDAVAMAIAPAARDSMASAASCFLGEGSLVSNPDHATARVADQSEERLWKDHTEGHVSASGYSSLDDLRQGLVSSKSNSRLALAATTALSANGHLTASSSFITATAKGESGNPTVSAKTSAASSVTQAGSEESLSDNAAKHAVGKGMHWSNGITGAPLTLAMGLWSLTAWATGQNGSVMSTSEQAVLDKTLSHGSERTQSAALLATRQMYILSGGQQRPRNPSSSSSSSSQASKHSRSPAGSRPLSHYRSNDAKLHPFPGLAAHLGLNDGGESLPPLGFASGRVNSMECGRPSALFHEGSQRHRTLRLSNGALSGGEDRSLPKGVRTSEGQTLFVNDEENVQPNRWWGWNA